MTFEEWKVKHDEEIVNVATVFFNYERGVDTRTCYDELEWLLRKAFISGQNHCNCVNNEELEKENTELKEQISIKDILIKELQEQKVYWKESSFDWRHKFFKLDKVKRLIKKDKQLTKAKEIIKTLADDLSMYSGNYQKELLEAEQFLKESE